MRKEMNVLYIATSFPSPKKGSTIYTDLAEALVKNGHKLTVVVSEERKNTKETYWSKERGCDVLRVRTGNLYDVSFIEKGITVLSLEYILKLAIKKYLSNKKFDLILYESPPVTNCGIVKYAKKKFNAKTYLMLKDIFPQNAVDIGIMKKNSFAYKMFKKKEENLYNISDVIGCMSEGNKRYVLEHNSSINPEKVIIFPNTKKINSLNKIENNMDLRKKYNIPLDSIVFIFGGNMGKPQGTELLCNAINKLKDNKDIFFLLVGRGTERENIKKFIENNKCTNVLQMDNLPRNEYEKMVKQCDVGLVLLDHRFTIPNYPSRILAYMEYAMPVIAATDRNTDFKELIEESDCGLWCCSDNIEEFCNNIITISKSKEFRKNKGDNGREYLEKNFSVSVSINLIEEYANNFL